MVAESLRRALDEQNPVFAYDNIGTEFAVPILFFLTVIIALLGKLHMCRKKKRRVQSMQIVVYSSNRVQRHRRKNVDDIWDLLQKE